MASVAIALKAEIPCRVRKGRPRDIKRLSSIWAELMRTHAGHDPAFALSDDAQMTWQKHTKQLIVRHDSFVLVAVSHRMPIGFCIGWVARNPPIYRAKQMGLISELAVEASFRRQGVGQALFHRARAWFKDHDLDEFQLATATWNEAAQRFWRREGGRGVVLRYAFGVEQA